MRRRLAVLAGAAWMAAAAAPASAQVIRTRPFPGLFGSGDPAKSVTQVDFYSYLAAGHETSTFSLAGGSLGTAQTDSTFGNLVFRGRLAHQGRRTTFGASGGATTSYFGTTSEMSPFSFSGNANYGGQVGRRGWFSLSQSIFYSPYYVYGTPTADLRDGSETDPDPNTGDSDPTVDPRIDQRVTRMSTKGYNTAVTAGQQVGRDGAFFAGYRFNYVDYVPGVYDLMSQSPYAGYRHKMSRFGYLIGSYGLHMYQYRGSGISTLSSQNVSAGVGYDRPLSTWRRTTIGFNFGTALVNDNSATRIYLNGTARLYRRFGRSGLTGVSYYRGQQVLEGFAVPFFTFSDALTGTVFTRLGRDIAVSGRLSYSHNTYTIDTLKNAFDTWYVSGRVQVPVMWALAFYTESFYTNQDFQRRLGLLEGIPSQTERLGIRAGVTVQLPVYR